MTKKILEKLELIEKTIKHFNELQQQKAWLDVSQAAIYCNCSESQVRKLISSDAIPFNRIGENGKIVFNSKILDLWLLNNGQKNTFNKADKKKLELIQ